MAAEILHLRSPMRWSKDWSQQDIAEFYRVESALIQAGFDLHTDRGLSDEGDPWFVFCRADSGEVFIHFARIDGEYVVDAGASGQAIRGANFTALVRDIIEKQPLIQARSRASKNVFLHPAALLIALVGGAFFQTHEAKAATVHADHSHGDTKRQIVFLTGASKEAQDQALDSVQVAAILTGVMIGLERQMDLAPTPGGIVHADAAGGPSTFAAPTPLPETPPASLAAADHAQFALTTPASYDARPVNRPLDIIAPWAGAADHTPAIHLSLSAAPEALPVWPSALAAPVSDFAPPAGAYAGLDPGALNAGGDAGQAIQWAESVANIGPAAVIQVSRLPSDLVKLINHGAHPAPAAVDVGVSAPTDTGGEAPTDTGVAPPPPVIASGFFDPHDPKVIAAGAAFLGVIHTPEVAIAGGNIVVYDGAIMGALPRGATLDSLTFQFTDGTALSLVGTHDEIQAIHWGQ